MKSCLFQKLLLTILGATLLFANTTTPKYTATSKHNKVGVNKVVKPKHTKKIKQKLKKHASLQKESDTLNQETQDLIAACHEHEQRVRDLQEKSNELASHITELQEQLDPTTEVAIMDQQ